MKKVCSLRLDHLASADRRAERTSLFKAAPAPPQSGPVDEVDAMDRRMQRGETPTSASKQAKWQPLTSVAPHPDTEDNDPFSLGDSDDEKEAKNKDTREEDSARLKKAASSSVAGDSADKPVLQASERSESSSHKDKDAEALLAGKSI